MVTRSNLIYSRRMFFRKYLCAKTLISTAVIVLFLAAAFGAPHLGMTMTMDEHGTMTMSDCYMPGMTAVCNMNALEHIASWQSAFASTLQEYGSTLLLLLLFAATAFMIVWVRQQYPPPRNLNVYRYRARQTRSLLPPTPLQELFSSGILHPKLF